ncbi:MAG: DUF86 domain-containing protein [Micrococcales bacterium]|nr:DUF86 domain-containing protein [Micrococcales bacterium]
MTDPDTARVERCLADLARFVDQASELVIGGEAAYLDAGFDGQMRRAFGEQIVLHVATVAERLPQSFRDEHPDVAWAQLRAMRNRIAHVYDAIDATVVWRALVVRIPELGARLLPADAD